MTTRHIGLLIYLAFYTVFYILFFTSSTAAWTPWVGSIGAVCLLIVSLWGIREKFQTSTPLAHRIVGGGIAVYALLLTVYTLWVFATSSDVSPLIFLHGVAFLWIVLELTVNRQNLKPFARIGMIVIFLLGTLSGIPLPANANMQAYATDQPSVFEANDKEGAILAPNVTARLAFPADWLYAQFGSSSENAAVDQAVQRQKWTYYEELNEFIGDTFAIPDHFYPESEQAGSEPQTLMKTLAKWNNLSADDVTQGKNIMGIGGIAPDGAILMVDHIESYVKAAIQADPDVLFVPVDAYDQAERIAPDLLIVPVSHFREVLFFLSQPVPFWALSNYALFCH